MIMNVGLSGLRGGAAGKRRRQQGFTLIELSIVLTIIGLIIGGILKGQELINNARLKSQVAQVDAVKSAVYTFQDKYNYLPGDFNSAAAVLGFAAAENGNGDGVIGATNASAPLADSVTVVGAESGMVWPELVAANLFGGYVLDPQFHSITAATLASPGNLPAKIAGTYLWLATFTSTPPSAGAVAQTGLMLRLQASSTGAAPLAAEGLKTADMVSLDSKYDDGMPGTGSIILDSVSTGCIGAAAAGANGGYGVATNGSPACVPLFVLQ